MSVGIVAASDWAAEVQGSHGGQPITSQASGFTNAAEAATWAVGVIARMPSTDSVTVEIRLVTADLRLSDFRPAVVLRDELATLRHTLAWIAAAATIPGDDDR